MSQPEVLQFREQLSFKNWKLSFIKPLASRLFASGFFIRSREIEFKAITAKNL